MNFNSWEFLLFLPVVVTVYHLLPHKVRWIWLLAASYFFYMSWNALLIFLIVGTTLVSYGAAIFIEKAQTKGWKKFWLITTIVVCIGALVFFKYAEFLLSNVIAVIRLFTPTVNDVALDLILPIGISFYTFQTLSYVIDVYKGKFAAEKHLGYYALFVSFFPQLVAGPIERPADLIPQLKAEHKFNWDDFTAGMRILAVGFFYKCVVADFLGIYVNRVFGNVAGANGLSVLVAGYLFVTQMYCDFAGYSEIATGAARLMGIKLSVNFYRPYYSVCYSDFFRRWHITLTRWFTDYVYIPLGGNRKGIFRKILNTFIVFALCGLWHGANWTYVVWGLYAALFMSIETLIKRPIGALLRKIGINTASKWMWVARIAVTFMVLIPAGIIFRANDLAHAGQMLATLFTSWNLFNGTYFATFLNSSGITALVAVQMVLAMCCEIKLWNYSEIGRYKKEDILVYGDKAGFIQSRRTVIMIYVVVLIMLSWIALLSTGDASRFQYFQF